MLWNTAISTVILLYKITKVKIICRGQGQLSRSYFSTNGHFKGISVSETHLVILCIKPPFHSGWLIYMQICMYMTKLIFCCYCPLTHSSIYIHFNKWKKKFKENNVEKGEIAHFEQFPLFPKCFLCNLYLKIL